MNKLVQANQPSFLSIAIPTNNDIYIHSTEFISITFWYLSQVI